MAKRNKAKILVRELEAAGPAPFVYWSSEELHQRLAMSITSLARKEAPRFRRLLAHPECTGRNFIIELQLEMPGFAIAASLGPPVLRLYLMELIHAAYPNQTIELRKFVRELVVRYARSAPTPLDFDVHEFTNALREIYGTPF